MSSVLQVTCDHCRGRIEEGRTLLKVASGALRDYRREIDLCPGCVAKFQEWLGTGGGGGRQAAAARA